MSTNRTRIPIVDQKQGHINAEGLFQGNSPKQLQTHYLLSDDVKISTAQIKEEIYYSLTSCGLFPDEQKRRRKGSRGTAELLYKISSSSTRAKPDRKI